MAKFDAATAVELLEYDFTKFGGTKGEVQEPTTGQVNAFFAEMRLVIQEVRAMQGKTGDMGGSTDGMSEEEIADRMAAIEEASEGAQHYQTRTVELIAQLCGAEWQDQGEDARVLVGGAPSFDDVSRLPYRILQAFSKWMVESIRPKEETPATRPLPQDRKRKSSSRAGTSS